MRLISISKGCSDSKYGVDEAFSESWMKVIKAWFFTTHVKEQITEWVKEIDNMSPNKRKYWWSTYKNSNGELSKVIHYTRYVC